MSGEGRQPCVVSKTVHLRRLSSINTASDEFPALSVGLPFSNGGHTAELIKIPFPAAVILAVARFANSANFPR